MMTYNLCTVLLTISEEPIKMTHKSAEEFVKMDPYGIGMSMIAMSIVFTVLAIVYLFFKNISKIYFAFQNKPVIKEDQIRGAINAPQGIEAEVSAAIGMALHIYHQRVHDKESLKITIEKVSKRYSPWNSKLYMMNRAPKN